MELLDNALERIKPYIIESLGTGDGGNDLSYRGPEDYGYFSGNDCTATVARLRLDWELSTKVRASPEVTSRLMLDTIKDDLLDLIENGDRDNLQDALLKTIDGSKKLGKEPRNIDIFSAQLFWEYKERNGMVEYTLYLLMAVQWEEK